MATPDDITAALSGLGLSDATASAFHGLFTQQAATIANLQAQLAQAPPPAPAPLPDIHNHTHNHAAPPRNGIEIATPADFDGTRENADGFMRACALYFEGPKGQNAQPEQQVAFALSYMKKGTAKGWAARTMKAIQEGTSTITDFPSFEALFRAQFDDPNPAATARIAINECTQRGRHADVFIAEFQDIASRTGHNDEAHAEKFMYALDTWLRERCFSVNPVPTTLTAWYTTARQQQLQHDQVAAMRSQRPGQFRFRGPAANPAQTAVQPVIPAIVAPYVAVPRALPQGEPMDIGRAARSVRAPPAGGCHECKGPHFARECPIRQAKFTTIRALFPAHAEEFILSLDDEEETDEPDFVQGQ